LKLTNILWAAILGLSTSCLYLQGFQFLPCWIVFIHSNQQGGGSHLALGAFIEHSYHALTLALARLSFLSI